MMLLLRLNEANSLPVLASMTPNPNFFDFPNLPFLPDHLVLSLRSEMK